jgi:hypothetical protein
MTSQQRVMHSSDAINYATFVHQFLLELGIGDVFWLMGSLFHFFNSLTCTTGRER